jgi:hypothetical protein
LVFLWTILQPYNGKHYYYLAHQNVSTFREALFIKNIIAAGVTKTLVLERLPNERLDCTEGTGRIPRLMLCFPGSNNQVKEELSEDFDRIIMHQTNYTTVLKRNQIF